MHYLKTILISLAIAGLHLASCVESNADDANESYTLGEMDADNQLSLRLSKQIEILKQRQQLYDLNSKIKEYADPEKQQKPPADVPWVTSVFGAKDMLLATIQFPDGSSVTISEGDLLPKGGRVIRISRSGVAVDNDGDVEIFAMSPAIRRGSLPSETPASKRSVFDSTKGGI